MQRGVMIGGGALVVLLGVFAGLFVVLNAGAPGGATPVDPTTLDQVGGEGGANAVRTANAVGPDGVAQPAGSPEAGDELPGDEQKPPGLGGEKWAEIRAQKTAEQQARASEVLERFLVGRPEADADILRDTFEHLFVTGAAVREDIQSGAITRQQGKAEINRLRDDTVRTVTETVGPEGLATLREELRKASASQF
jgi:hypothetical protein